MLTRSIPQAPARFVCVALPILFVAKLHLVVAVADVITKANFKTKVSGKNAFVNFMLRGESHCQALQPSWDQLVEANKGSRKVVVASVDCDAADSESLCAAHSVLGYPTLRYMTEDTGEHGEDYTGDRDFASLDAFVKGKLSKRRCVPKTRENCNDKENNYIDKMVLWEKENIEKETKRLQNLALSGSVPEKKLEWLLKRIEILTHPGSTKDEL